MRQVQALYNKETIEEPLWTVTAIPDAPDPIVEDLPILSDAYSLCSALGYNGKYPWYVVRFANKCYSNFWIDKDTRKIVPEFNPSLRLRAISAPTAALKELQSRLCDLVLNKLPKHPANYAYMKGLNVRDAAEKHKDADVLVRVDLKDFFTMHNEHFVRSRLSEITGYSKEICWFITKLCALNGHLPQGSVTSPILSIILNKKMDEDMEAIALKYKLVYTRYADDLCFSGANKSDNILTRMVSEISDIVHPFKVNWGKVDIMRNRSSRSINGVVYSCVPIVLNALEVLTAGAGLKQKRTETKLVVTSDKPLEDKTLAALLSYAPTEDAVRPHYFYRQGIQHMLGINLTDGIKYPREKYLKLRVEALLARKKCPSVNMAKFRGRLAFMRLVDPNKASKIDKILAKKETI